MNTYKAIGWVIVAAGGYLFLHSLCFDVCPADSNVYSKVWPFTLAVGFIIVAVCMYLEERAK